MSATVLLIAAAHAVPVVVVAVWTRSKMWTAFAAFASALAGVFFGDASYMAHDLIVVLAASIFCLSYLKRVPRDSTPAPLSQPSEPKAVQNENWAWLMTPT